MAFLHEHFVQRAHTADTLRTYAEILYDWFETLEQNAIVWSDADAVDLVAYRNRMMLQPSSHTGRPYRISTINHRVRGVLRFYEWAVRTRWLAASSLVGRPGNFARREAAATGSRREHADDRPQSLRAAAVRTVAASARLRAGARTLGAAATALRPDGALAALHRPAGKRTAAARRQGRHRATRVSGVAPHDRRDAQGAQARLRDRLD